MSPRARNAAAERHACAPIFAALGDETRLALVTKLSEGHACSIAQLTEGTALTRQAVTKHLRVLTNARIVKNVKSGRESLFELDPAPLREVRDYADVVSSQWDAALGRLKAFLEK
jgi:DNA-binding transcriptional ArsR family regulator